MASIRELLASVSGQRVTPWKSYTGNPDTDWGEGGSQSYGHMNRDPAGKWVVPNHTSGSDYSGSLVERSNYRILLEACETAEAERQQTRRDFPQEGDSPLLAFYVELHGGHGTFALALHLERTPESIAEMVVALEDYPLANEDDHSELESEAQEEAWDNWAAGDYRKLVEAHYRGECDTCTPSPEDALLTHFRDAADKANVYWENQSGGDMYIDLARIAKVAFPQLPPPEGFRLDGPAPCNCGASVPGSGLKCATYCASRQTSGED